MKETTFQETERFLTSHGWEIIKPGEYQDLKRNKKHQNTRQIVTDEEFSERKRLGLSCENYMTLKELQKRVRYEQQEKAEEKSRAYKQNNFKSFKRVD